MGSGSIAIYEAFYNMPLYLVQGILSFMAWEFKGGRAVLAIFVGTACPSTISYVDALGTPVSQGSGEGNFKRKAKNR